MGAKPSVCGTENASARSNRGLLGLLEKDWDEVIENSDEDKHLQ